MDKQEILESTGEFTEFPDQIFLISTQNGSYIWDKPLNTIKVFNGSVLEFCRNSKIEFGKDRGVHVISELCPQNITIEG